MRPSNRPPARAARLGVAPSITPNRVALSHEKHKKEFRKMNFGIEEILDEKQEYSQGRNYFLTVNNPTQSDEEFFEFCKNLDHIQYFVFQREQGESGTQHFQLYIEFTIGKRFDTIKNYFPTAHIQKRKGTKKQAKEYCTKAETRIGKVYEFGDLVDEGTRTDIEEMIAQIENGIDEYEFNKMFRGQTTRYPNFYQKNKALYMQKKYRKAKRNDIVVNYIWGKSRTGKTSFVNDKYGYENVYSVNEYKHPFDMYEYQDIILFDDFRGQIEDITKMLHWLDVHPVTLPSRYNNKQACYTKVYFTSDLPPEKLYAWTKTTEHETWEALQLRIHNVYHFDNPNDKEKLLQGLPNKNKIAKRIEYENGMRVLSEEEIKQVKIPF